MSAIPVLRKLRQEDLKLEVNLNYIVGSCFDLKTK